MESRGRGGGRRAQRAAGGVSRSWAHPAFEHLIGDRRGDLVQESRPHVRVLAQELNGPLFLRRLRLSLRLCPLLRKLLARGGLVLLDILVDHLVNDRILLRERDAREHHGWNGRQLGGLDQVRQALLLDGS